MRPRSLERGAGIVAAFAALAAAGAEPPPSPVPLRVLVAPGPLAADPLREHLTFARAADFNAVWFTSGQAGRWTAEEAPQGPALAPEFHALARWCARRGLRPFLELRPVEDTQGRRLFSDRSAVRRLQEFARLARDRAGVRDFVVSFDGAPRDIEDLWDLVTHGRAAAPLHVEMTARIARLLGEPTHVWLRPAISNDADLEARDSRYGGDLPGALARLPSRVGIVWSGPQAAAPAVTAADLHAARGRLGGRALLLYDPFPPRALGSPAPLAIVLGALEGREPAIRDEIAGYVCGPGDVRGGARLSLLTVADFLRDPRAYDPERSARAAVERLAGPDAAAVYALRTQVLEWGGWIGGGGYHTLRTDTPRAAALALADPAIVAGWTWTVRRYPERMQALAQLADARFREDLLVTMARRLAVARAVPVVVELLARRAAGNPDVEPLEGDLTAQRAALEGQPAAREALERFLAHAGIDAEAPR